MIGLATIAKLLLSLVEVVADLSHDNSKLVFSRIMFPEKSRHVPPPRDVKGARARI